MNDSVAADDIKGRNNCPEHLRIIASWHIERPWATHSTKPKKCYAIIDGKKVLAESYRDLATKLGVDYSNMLKAKRKTKMARTYSYRGIIFGALDV
jgi:hypothetical protein